MTGRPGVFLDRDGVINDLCYDPEHGLVDCPLSADQFRIKPGVPEALRMLQSSDYALVVVSNQPAVAKGKTTLTALAGITARMREELGAAGVRLDDVRYCLHHPEAVITGYRRRCGCRKPEAGLIFRASHELGLSLAASWLVGDGFTDIEAARRAGCRSVWLGSWKCEHCQLSGQTGSWPHARARTLSEAAEFITAERRRS